jgi:hypothetical protein
MDYGAQSIFELKLISINVYDSSFYSQFVLISMFEQILILYRNSTHCLLTHLCIALCVIIILPHSHFAMGYFNRLTG